MTTGHEPVAVTKAAPIKVAERDRELGLDDGTWPTHVPDGWAWDGQALTRIIAANEAQRVPAALQEIILRFPSAPVHGMHRLHEHHMKLGSSESFHSMRILRSADPKHREDRVTRIFLMNTGLNERTTMELYYWLASLLVQQESGTVCVVRPFPGHLTRYPFQGLAETPLDSYLWDGSHLFRQFLRYMLETQWFLSAIVRRSSYRCASGANLLGESDNLDQSRLNGEFLAKEMREIWMALCEASRRTVDLETPENQPDRPPLSEPPPEQAFRDSIDALRDVLNLERDYKHHSGALEPTRNPVEPNGRRATRRRREAFPRHVPMYGSCEWSRRSRVPRRVGPVRRRRRAAAGLGIGGFDPYRARLLCNPPRADSSARVRLALDRRSS